MGKNGTKIIKLFPGCFFLVVILSVSSPYLSAQSKEVRKSERRYERLLKREKKAYEKQRKAVLEHRMEIQTEAVQQRMKETARRSSKYGRIRKDPWYKRWFNPKKRRKKKARR
jgi:hypothetical protein